MSKPSAKPVWDQLESLWLRSNCVRMSSAQRVQMQYENISLLNDESLDNFALCLKKMVHGLEILDDPEECPLLRIDILFD
jgi:hypothetical protein